VLTNFDQAPSVDSATPSHPTITTIIFLLFQKERKEIKRKKKSKLFVCMLGSFTTCRSYMLVEANKLTESDESIGPYYPGASENPFEWCVFPLERNMA
jgi:hypothetical protein